MKKTNLIPIIFVTTLLLSGCLNNPPTEQTKSRQVTQTTQCTPDYVKLGVLDNSNKLNDAQAMENCKASCYDKYRLTSYKLEFEKMLTNIPMMPDQNLYTCYCDTNDCGGSELVKTTRS